MGKILLQNKMVTVYRNQTIVDISMMISGVTDMIKVGAAVNPWRSTKLLYLSRG